MIGNKLQITVSLYERLKEQIDRYNGYSLERQMEDKVLYQNIVEMEKDIRDSDNQQTKDMMKIFIIYRADIGYIRGMNRLMSGLLDVMS